MRGRPLKGSLGLVDTDLRTWGSYVMSDQLRPWPGQSMLARFVNGELPGIASCTQGVPVYVPEIVQRVDAVFRFIEPRPREAVFLWYVGPAPFDSASACRHMRVGPRRFADLLRVGRMRFADRLYAPCAIA